MRYQAIFWDNDGVLVDTEHLYFQANRQVFLNLGMELDLNTYHQFFLVENRGAWHLLESLGCGQEAISEFRLTRDSFYRELLAKQNNAISGAAEILAELQSKIKMGVVTSSLKDAFDIIHQRTGFLSYFDFIVAHGDYLNSKPSPDPYLRALELSGNKPEECLVIEDSERGLTAAKSAGLECWVIPTAMTKQGDFSKADRILSSINQISSLIFKD